MIGQTVGSRYTITSLLGQGGMGTVYRATDGQTGQDVAVKILARGLAPALDSLERFRREGESLRQLRHPNIVGFVDSFESDGRQVIVMEFVPGGSLQSLLQSGPLPVERARRIALDLCDAIVRAHRLKIVHRDIKPENILMAADGTPKLTDFGVARLSEGTRLTGTGAHVGTPFYMAPEAWEGRALDVRADIWSLGIVLYEMLVGEVPFGGDTLVAVMNRVLTAPLPDLTKVRPDLPRGLVAIVEKMLARDVSARYQTAREVAVDLEKGQPSQLVSSATVNRFPDFRGWLQPLAAVVAIGLLFALFVWSVGWVRGSLAASSVETQSPVPLIAGQSVSVVGSPATLDITILLTQFQIMTETQMVRDSQTQAAVTTRVGLTQSARQTIVALTPTLTLTATLAPTPTPTTLPTLTPIPTATPTITLVFLGEQAAEHGSDPARNIYLFEVSGFNTLLIPRDKWGSDIVTSNCSSGSWSVENAGLLQVAVSKAFPTSTCTVTLRWTDGRWGQTTFPHTQTTFPK